MKQNLLYSKGTRVIIIGQSKKSKNIPHWIELINTIFIQIWFIIYESEERSYYNL